MSESAQESKDRQFRMTPFGRWIASRALGGLLAIALANLGLPLAAAALLLGSVAADVATDSIARRRAWSRGASEVQLEGFADFVCFVWAPLQFVLALHPGPWVWPCGLAFVVAGGFRLARFNVEGLTGTGYRGLPVTYSGVVFPLVALALQGVGAWAAAAGYSLTFVAMGLAMASDRFVFPRVIL